MKKLGKKHLSYATTLSNLSVSYQYQGILDKAEELLIKAKDIRKNLKGEKDAFYIQSLNNLGALYHTQNLLDKAEAKYTEAIHLATKVLGEKHSLYAFLCCSLGSIKLSRGDYDQAEELFLKAVSIGKSIQGQDRPYYALYLSNLARLYQIKGLLDKAEPLYQKAKLLANEIVGKYHPLYINGVHDFADLYVNRNNFSQAKKLYEEVSQLIINQTQNNFNHLSEYEKNIFFNTFSKYFNRQASFTLKAYQQDPSLTGWLYNNILVIKNMLFQSTRKMRQRILNSNDDELKRKLQNWQEKRDLLAQFYSLSENKRQQQNIDLHALEEEVNYLEKELSLRASKLKGLQKIKDLTGEKVQSTWQDIQKKLKANEAAIEISRIQYYDNKLIDSVVYIALIVKPDTQGQPEMVVLSEGKFMEGRYFNRYRNALQYQREDLQSYDIYWQKIAERIPGSSKVYFSSDGVYHQINLNTLQNPNTGKYLIEEVDIQLIGSAKSLLKTDQPVQNQQTAILLGRPTYDLNATQHQQVTKNYKAERGTTQDLYNIGEKMALSAFKDLPGTEKETRNIHNKLKTNNWESYLYLQENALEEVVKEAQSPRVLHIATHGFFLEKNTPESTPVSRDNNQLIDLNINYYTRSGASSFSNAHLRQVLQKNPLLRSGIVLTGVSTYAQSPEKYDTEDGILTAYEAMNLNLDDTELLVLSACETGKGDVQNGQGVYGLQRGFQTAGVRTVLMSLWNVNDDATQELMTEFYHQWLSGNSKREAFKIAQLALKSKYPHPYYWGAFVMVGE